MLKFYVRTTGKRNLHESFNQIKFDLIVDNEDFAKHFPQHLVNISDTDIVLLEDDIILCENFESKIKRAISLYPDNIINFFNKPLFYSDPYLEKEFYFNQCVYIPKKLILPLANAMLNYKINGFKINTVNHLMRYALHKLNLEHIIYKPCWDEKTLSPNRRSPFFVDYLNELGIKWKEANTEENLHKLYNLMEEKFKEIDSKGTRYKHNWYKTCNFQFKEERIK